MFRKLEASLKQKSQLQPPKVETMKRNESNRVDVRNLSLKERVNSRIILVEGNFEHLKPISPS